MKLKIFQVDAFSDKLFSGNPAAVVPLRKWLPISTLQSIAMENNLSETAFFVEGRKSFELRWFTPAMEVDLCGHATLATAYVIFNLLRYTKKEIHFSTRSGELIVKKNKNKLIMDFPSISSYPINIDSKTLNDLKPVEVLGSRQDLMVILPTESSVKECSPYLKENDFGGYRGLILTAKGEKVDFVSRYLYWELGTLQEDPVTGSAHCQLAPYWAQKLDKKILKARQLSRRGGKLTCEVEDNRVFITGTAILYSVGEIEKGAI